jgi:Carboxypeptidase regulatory-like domain/Cupin domain
MSRVMVSAVVLGVGLSVPLTPAAVRAQTDRGTTTQAQAPSQTPPRTQTTGRGTSPRAAAARTTSARVTVRDQNGESLAGVRVTLSGTSSGEFTTGAAGTAIIPDLKPGPYRLRLEHDGFVTLEREFTLASGAWNPIDVVLSAAPPPPPPPPKPAAAPAPSAPLAPSGPPVTLSIPDYLDRNLIGGKQPIKESILACTPLETVRLLQVRDSIASHVHDRMDEVIYVVAGEGAVKMADGTKTINAGTLVVVPRGSDHAFERRGKNPLIVVSTLAGAPCEAPKPAP